MSAPPWVLLLLSLHLPPRESARQTNYSKIGQGLALHSAKRLVNMPARGAPKDATARMACLQVVYPTLSVVKEQSFPASLVRLEKELFPLYLGHPRCGRPLVGGYAQTAAMVAPIQHYAYTVNHIQKGLTLLFHGRPPPPALLKN
jgi:hypothetical protein